MEIRILAALLVGMIIGATSAAALTPSTAVETKQQTGTTWSADYAAIPHDAAQREQAPTF